MNETWAPVRLYPARDAIVDRCRISHHRVDGPWGMLLLGGGFRCLCSQVEKIKEFWIVRDVNVSLTKPLPLKHGDRVEFHHQEGGYEGLRRLMA